MIYYSILFSLCLMGMASADIEVCLNETALQVTCSPKTGKTADCVLKAEQPANVEGKECKLTVPDVEKKKAFKITCAFGEDKFEKAVDMSKEKDLQDDKKIKVCSGGSVLQFAGVTLLMTLFTPLLSGVL
ncbi:hypothetical protein AMEX_G339 [Astyanax mexicanus]|uniref:Uncharacterized protein n=1 Tax=Astyanax mexicanus TaxID=7994 RepID=A0A8T2MIW7_ASTMX|nr:hypothetical protein AMEX_G339 [Astyanax mexicanus]